MTRTSTSIPVYLYDVVTAAESPRLVVTCLTERDALSLTTRLALMPLWGDEAFTVAAPRLATVEMDVSAGSSTEVMGYTVATGVMAADARASRAAKVEPVTDEKADEITDEKADEVVVPPAANPTPGPVR